MSGAIVNRLDKLFMNFSDWFSNRSFPAEPEVSGHTLPTGQSPSLRHSVSTHVDPMRLQSDVGGPMPQSSGSAHPTLGKSSIGLGFSSARAPYPQASAEALEAAQAEQVMQTAQIDNSDWLQASAGHQVFVREPEDEGDQESVLFPMDKTFNHLVNFIYEQYPDSHAHSDPLVPPCCELVFFCYFGSSGHRPSEDALVP